jgi:hypothetical protein
MNTKPILAALAVTLSALPSSAMAETFTQDAAGNLTHTHRIPDGEIPTDKEARAVTEKHLATINAKEAKQAAQAATELLGN